MQPVSHPAAPGARKHKQSVQTLGGDLHYPHWESVALGNQDTTLGGAKRGPPPLTHRPSRKRVPPRREDVPKARHRCGLLDGQQRLDFVRACRSDPHRARPVVGHPSSIATGDLTPTHRAGRSSHTLSHDHRPARQQTAQPDTQDPLSPARGPSAVPPAPGSGPLDSRCYQVRRPRSGRWPWRQPTGRRWIARRPGLVRTLAGPRPDRRAGGPVGNELKRKGGYPDVSRGPSLLRGVLEQRPPLPIAFLQGGQVAQAEQGPGDATPVTKLLIQGLALPVERERRGRIALLDRQRPDAR